jgi:hypothetical protein
MELNFRGRIRWPPPELREDCQVCCKPNVLRMEYDSSSQEFFITAELE